MKSRKPVKSGSRRSLGVRRGRCRVGAYTLVELTLAIGLALGVSSAVIGVLAQHSTFMAMLTQFKFLRDDAPQVNSLMSRLTGQAVSYRLYASKADAFAGTGAVNANATAMRLMFRNPSGALDHAVVAFETFSGTGKLNYYQFNGGWGTQPDWTITSKPVDVFFDDTSGVFEMTLIGPKSERITYAGTTE